MTPTTSRHGVLSLSRIRFPIAAAGSRHSSRARFSDTMATGRIPYAVFCLKKKEEVMTPNSSRFWAADVYKTGQPQPSFYKQPQRDYLDAERRAGRWNG